MEVYSMAQVREERLARSFGLRLKVARVAQGMSLRDLEDATGISQSLLAKYERNAVWPPRARLETLCHTLRVDPNYLLGWDSTTRLLGSTPGGRAAETAEFLARARYFSDGYQRTIADYADYRRAAKRRPA